MSYTTTPALAIQKAVVGSNQPFETAVINSNWDKIDTAVAGYGARFTTIEADADALNAQVDTLATDVAELVLGVFPSIDGGTA